MSSPFGRFLKAESKMLLPNPDEALNLGYASHCADDPSLKGTQTQKIATLAVERFAALKAEPNTTEDAYLACIRGIVLSHARGLTRRKHAWIKDLEFALAEKKGRELRMNEARKSNSGLSAAWKLLGPVILLLAGYLFGKMLTLLVPVDISTQTGARLPSVLLGLVFVFVGRAVTFWFYDRDRHMIESEYRARCRHADLAYELGKRTEYQLYRTRLCEAWSEYTGEHYPETASYEMVMAGDIATRQLLEKQLQIYDRTSLWLLRRIVRIVRRKKKNVPVALAQAQQESAT